MSTLFLIGNGFDINSGMKTRYRDVYKGYINEMSSSEIVKQFKGNISSDIGNWGDFEMAMAKYAEKLNSEDELLECVRDFTAYMNGYLLEEENKFNANLTDSKISYAVLEELNKSFSDFYSGISHNVNAIMKNRNAGEANSIRAISFNYTDAFDRVFENYIKNSMVGYRKVIHIHGVLQDDPVLGIDNIEQLNVSYRLSKKGRRGFIKPVFNEQFDELRVRQAISEIKNANTICIFGMSLGESDLTWRNEIIKWLKNGENNHLFIYNYELSGLEFRTIDEKMDREDDEKDKLFLNWGIESSDSLFEQIHVLCGKNIFNISEVIMKEIKKEFIELREGPRIKVPMEGQQEKYEPLEKLKNKLIG